MTINKSIEVDATLVRADIGVLDIFGFECFKHNSFEQLCINYTNETLQQQFNQFVFKEEQKQYQKEKIEWSFVEFPDNQDCLDLIENKQKGILAMLDDECKLPGAADRKFADRLYKALAGTDGGHPRFSVTAPQKRDHQFCIRHYAGPVVYTAATFVDKNKDELPREAEIMLGQSTVPLISKVFSATTGGDGDGKARATVGQSARGGGANAVAPGGGGGGSSRGGGGTAQSVGTQFKTSLNSLMQKIYSTTPHYIRCLKPNDQNVPDNFHRSRTTEQLRYGGVLEAVRVARSGFPVRLSHSEFYSRYRPLANPFNAITTKLPRHIKDTATDAKGMCETLLLVVWDDHVPEPATAETPAAVATSTKKTVGTRRASRIMDVSMWQGKATIAKESVQLGVTKVFLRKQAHDLLEARRSRRLASAVRKIQSLYRGFFFHIQYLQTKWAVRLIQRVVRGHLARVRVTKLRWQKAALKVQTSARRFFACIRFKSFRFALIRLQSHFRKHVALKLTADLRHKRRVLTLQRLVRGLVRRYHFTRYRRAVVRMQCGIRRRMAIAQLKKLKMDAKSLGKMQQDLAALKAEMDIVRARAAEKEKLAKEQAIEEARKQQEEAMAEREKELQAVAGQMSSFKEKYEIEHKLRLSLEDQLSSKEEQIDVLIEELSRSKIALASLERLEQELAVTKERLEETEAELAEAEMALQENTESLTKELDAALESVSTLKEEQVYIEVKLAAAIEKQMRAEALVRDLEGELAMRVQNGFHSPGQESVSTGGQSLASSPVRAAAFSGQALEERAEEAEGRLIETETALVLSNRKLSTVNDKLMKFEVKMREMESVIALSQKDMTEEERLAVMAAAEQDSSQASGIVSDEEARIREAEEKMEEAEQRAIANERQLAALKERFASVQAELQASQAALALASQTPLTLTTPASSQSSPTSALTAPPSAVPSFASSGAPTIPAPPVPSAPLIPPFPPTTPPPIPPTMPAIDIEEHEKTLKNLAEERAARELLQEEVSRLRHISLDLKAQLETQKRSTMGSAAAAQRRPDAEPKRRTSVGSQNDNPESVTRRQSLQPPSRNNSRRSSMDGKSWNNTWDGDEDEDENENEDESESESDDEGDDSTSNTESEKSRESFKSGSSSQSRSKVSTSGATANRVSQPVRKNSIQAKAATGAAGNPPASKAGVTIDGTNPLKSSSGPAAIGQFEKNLDAFRGKLKLVLLTH